MRIRDRRPWPVFAGKQSDWKCQANAAALSGPHRRWNGMEVMSRDIAASALWVNAKG